MKPIIDISRLTEDQAREILGLVPTIYKQEGENVFDEMALFPKNSDHGPTLVICLVIPDRKRFEVRLVIRESGEIFVQDLRYEREYVINAIPIIDYLREIGAVASPVTSVA